MAMGNLLEPVLSANGIINWTRQVGAMLAAED